MDMKRDLRDAQRKIDGAQRTLDNILLKDGRWQPGKFRTDGRRRFLNRILRLFLLIAALFFLLPPFYIPVKGQKTSGYFIRMRPESGLITDLEIHNGVDIAAPTGTPIKGAAPGIVAFAGTSPGWGNYIVVNHLFGFNSVYAHASALHVRQGEIVIPGMTILGKVGQTGRATGNHLHFEIRAGNLSLPPGTFLFFHNLRRYFLGF